MIIKAFAEELNKQDKKPSPLIFLDKWLKEILAKKPENHVENIIHTELSVTKITDNSSLITTNSESGEVLLNALYQFCLSYENFLFARWLHEKNASNLDC